MSEMLRLPVAEARLKWGLQGGWKRVVTGYLEDQPRYRKWVITMVNNLPYDPCRILPNPDAPYNIGNMEYVRTFPLECGHFSRNVGK